MKAWLEIIDYRMRILIGEISSYKAIVIVRHVRELYPDIEIIGYDVHAVMQRCHTKCVHEVICIKPKDKKDYVNQLSQVVHTRGIDILIPVHSDYIGLILDHKELFGHTLDYMGNYEDYIQLHDKSKLMRIATQCGVRVPKQFVSISEAQIPFVIKPTNLSSAKGVRYCFSEAERDSGLLVNGERDIIQEYIAGQGCGYSVYCENGIIQCEYGHMRLAEYPITGGSSVLRRGYVHPDMRSMVERILSAVPWTGFAMFEFKLTKNGELVLIEVNPRIWGSIHQALADGVDFFAYIFGRKEGACKQNIHSTIRTCLVPQIYMSLLRYKWHGRGEIYKEYKQYKEETIKDVSFFEDPRGMLSMILRKIL